jgi:protein-S-isoprenylcysteine O-methyltransferase Ste14
VAVTLLAFPVFFALFMFLPAGTLAWTRGWLFVGALLGTVAAAGLCLWRANPDVVIARTSSHQGTKRWDKVLLSVLLPLVYSLVPIAALDDARFHWLPLPWWVSLPGYALMLGGFAIVAWAESVNKFFEPTVRIQTDREHRVVDTGPYALVRHPGYAAAMLAIPGMALALGSAVALIPAAIVSALFILRTKWEDQTLQAELAGYREYADRVRFKSIPGVW